MDTACHNPQKVAITVYGKMACSVPGIFVFPDEALSIFHPSASRYEGEEFVILANVDLVDDNDLQISQKWLAECLLQVLLVDAPNHRVTDAPMLSHIPNGHHLSQIDTI